jgi:hypothetical protein
MQSKCIRIAGSIGSTGVYTALTVHWPLVRRSKCIQRLSFIAVKMHLRSWFARRAPSKNIVLIWCTQAARLKHPPSMSKLVACGARVAQE